MNFEHFLEIVNKIKNEPNSATTSHAKMEPKERVQFMKDFDYLNFSPKNAAVMMLVYPKKNNANLALILRTSYNGVHSSQVAFPGGKAENFDKNFLETALRETHEEIGVSPDKITYIKDFTPLYVPPSNFMVYPFMGFCKNELIFEPDPNEVAGILELSLKDFLDENIVSKQKIITSYMDETEVYGYNIEGHFVWGATAMMLSELKDMINKVL